MPASPCEQLHGRDGTSWSLWWLRGKSVVRSGKPVWLIIGRLPAYGREALGIQVVVPLVSSAVEDKHTSQIRIQPENDCHSVAAPHENIAYRTERWARSRVLSGLIKVPLGSCILGMYHATPFTNFTVEGPEWEAAIKGYNAALCLPQVSLKGDT